MDSSKVPPISPELVKWLSGLFPDECPAPTVSDREVWLAAGAARVVRKLRHESEKQHRTVLADDS